MEIKPLTAAITDRRVSSRQVNEHWRRAGRRTNRLQRGDGQQKKERTDPSLFTLA